MKREFWRLAWRTLTSWRHKEPPLEHPGHDNQWKHMPHDLNRFNEQAQADEDDWRWTP